MNDLHDLSRNQAEIFVLSLQQVSSLESCRNFSVSEFMSRPEHTDHPKAADPLFSGSGSLSIISGSGKGEKRRKKYLFSRFILLIIIHRILYMLYQFSIC